MIGGIFLSFLINILSNSIGVSGSGILLCLLIFLFEFATKKAITVYKISLLFASLFNAYHVLTNRSESNPNKLNINWNLVGLCIPIMVSGNMLGIVLNNLLPPAYLLGIVLFLVILTLIMTSIKTKKKQKLLRKNKLVEEVPDKEK